MKTGRSLASSGSASGLFSVFSPCLRVSVVESLHPRRGWLPGTSLVEILVVLVVLVIGIFSLVRLFPAGFGSILYGENVTRGSALTRAELERVRTASVNLPDAIGPIDPVTGAVDVTLDPGADYLPYPPPDPAQPNVKQLEDPRFSDVNHYRRVWGETAKIPAPTSECAYMPIVDSATGRREPVSLYTLQFSPMYSTRRLLVYSGTPLERMVLEGAPQSDAELRELGDSRYGIDYRNAILYFAPVPYPRRFKLDYSYTIPQGGNQFFRASSVPDSCIYLAPNVTRFTMREAHTEMPADCRFFPLPSGSQLELEEEQLYRAFEPILDAARPFSPVNPFEFKPLQTIMGIIGFNPLAASGAVSGGKPLVAKVDYDVDDWHILREDRVVPQSLPFNVDLTLGYIKRVGDIEEIQQPYEGLIRNFATFPINPDQQHPGTPGMDLIIVDLDTGLTMDSRTLQVDPNALVEVNNINGRLDYRRGRIEFNSIVRWSLPDGNLGPETPVAGRRIRVFYRTEADWALQVTKAFSQYRRELEPALLGYGQYVQNRGDLFFPPIDHDHSVVVDYTWVQLVNGQKRVRTESGELHKIGAPSAPDSPQTLGTAALPTAWWVRLNTATRPDIAADEPIVIRSVRGVSVTARAMWRESGRWRRLEHTTLLAR